MDKTKEIENSLKFLTEEIIRLDSEIKQLTATKEPIRLIELETKVARLWDILTANDRKGETKLTPLGRRFSRRM